MLNQSKKWIIGVCAMDTKGKFSDEQIKDMFWIWVRVLRYRRVLLGLIKQKIFVEHQACFIPLKRMFGLDIKYLEMILDN